MPLRDRLPTGAFCLADEIFCWDKAIEPLLGDESCVSPVCDIFT
jgi:hypothetical protein